jgi:MYXO-CTERM domain-containing protein
MQSAGDTSAYSLKSRLLASVDGLASLSGKVASGGRLNAAAALAAQPVTAPSGGGGGGRLALLSILVLVAWQRRKR